MRSGGSARFAAIFLLSHLLCIGTTESHASPNPNQLPKGMAASKMGVSEDNLLWYWNPVERTVVLMLADGAPQSVELPIQAASVDVDRVRGIVALAPTGTDLQIYDWAGKLMESVALTEQAGDVAWLDDRAVVVTPKFGTYRAEIWNLDSGSRTRSLVSAPAVERPNIGVHLARVTLVRYSSRRKEISLIDALEGAILVVGLDGQAIRTTHAATGLTPELQRWLKDMDTNARAEGSSQAPAMWHYPTASLDRDGSIWLGESKDEKTVTLFHALVSGKVERTTMRVGCPSVRVTAWDNYLIFFADPRVPQEGCPTVQKRASSNTNP